jgi:hypothetical protein
VLVSPSAFEQQQRSAGAVRDDEYDELVAFAQDRNLPVSTAARALLLQSPAPQEDLKGALDRLEQDLSAVRRKALSA